MFAMNALPAIHSESVFEAIRGRTVLLYVSMCVCMYMYVYYSFYEFEHL